MIVAQGSPVVSPVLIGRAAERASLQAVLDRLGDGQGQTVAMAGEAGIGKSRLVAEAQAHAQQQDYLCLRGQCFEQDRTIPYAPLLDLLQVLLATQSGEAVITELRAASPELVNLLPQLAASLPSLRTNASADPQQQKLRLVRTLVQWFTDLATTRPLLVTIEDLHWSDENTLEFLARLARQTVAAPIVLLVTYRTDEVHAELASLLVELRRARLLQELQLGPLDEAEVDAMLGTIFQLNRPVRSDFLKRITSLTEGNPFFVEEVLSSLIRAGDVFLSGGQWDRRPVSELRIPPTIHDAVVHRAAQLSVAARDLLSLAAVAGRRFEFTMLQTLTGHSEDTLLRLIKELVAAQLVVEESAERFAFRHALTREAIFSQLLARERRVLHQRIADCLEELHRADLEAHLEDLARHYFEAAVWPKALDYNEQAAQRAQQLHAPQAAIEHLSRALLAGQQLGHTPLVHLYGARADAYETVGAFDQARSDHEHVLQLARASEDRYAECRARLGLGFVWTAQDYQRAGAEFRAALELAGQIGDAALLARSLNRFANWQVNVGQPLEALGHHRQALAIFERQNDRRGMAETLDLLGLAAVHSGDSVRGADYYLRAAEVFRELDDRRGLASCLAMLSQLGAMSYLAPEVGPTYGLAASAGFAEEAIALTREIGWRAGEAFALAGLTLALELSGAHARALQTGRTCLAIAEEVEHQQWIAMAHLVLGGVYLDLLALPLAQQHLERSRAIAEDSGSTIFAQQAIALLGRMYLAGGQLAAADAILRQGHGDDGPASLRQERWIWLVRADLMLAQKQPARALDIADQLAATATGTGAQTGIPLIWLLRGEALTHMDRLEEAEDALRAVLQITEADGVRMFGARTRAALSTVLRKQRRFVEADELVAAAHAMVEEIAAQTPDDPIAELAGASLRTNFRRAMTVLLPRSRLQTPLRAAKQRYVGLTARERQVAVLVAQGKSNPQIATALVVGNRTAQTHVANILRKLGCTSRAQVAAWVAERGLLDTS